MFCNTFDHYIDEVKNALGFGVRARRVVSVINAAQECAQAVLIHGVTAWEQRRVCCNIAECERHGCDQEQHGECPLSVLSPCCGRRIRPSRPMSPNHHRALLAKRCGFTEEELNFIINYDIKYRMGDKLNAAA